MAFGFPAYHRERYSPPASATDVRDAVRDTLNALDWPIREERQDGIVALIGMNLFSWGEKVEVSFLADGAISITSKCTLPAQCVDWGKNQANVTRFLAEMRNHV